MRAIRTSRLRFLVLPFAAFLSVLPLLVYGPSCGHDLDFHLISWLEAAKQFQAGNLHPHWAFSPAFGAGEPRFVFYPPISWYIGAGLTLLLQHLPGIAPDRAFVFAPGLYTWIALSGAGLAAYALVRRYTSSNAALLSATLYVVNPYTIFTAYERSAFAELLAAAWIPLLLLAILPAPAPGDVRDPAQPVSVPLLALAVALLWLTNAPAAVMGCYTVALVAVLRLAHLYWKARSVRPLLAPAARFVAGTSLGLALAAFYIVPAAYEQRWVEITMSATVPGMRIADNTLFHHTADIEHDATLHTASILAILLLALTAAALLSAWLTRNRPPARAAAPQSASRTSLLALLAILASAVALLLTRLALPLWQHAPELTFLQFPWRFLAILAAVLALAVALALRPAHIPGWTIAAVTLLVPAALAFGPYRDFRQFCDPGEPPQAQLSVFKSTTGTEPTDEYTPVTADNDALHPGNPSLRLTPERAGASTPIAAAPGKPPAHIDLDLAEPQTLTLNLRDYPAWRIERNGAPMLERIAREDGLIAFTLPRGHSHIDISYRLTPDQQIGDAISLIALCLFAPLSILSLRRRSPPTYPR